MRRKPHEPLPQEGLDEPFGPPPEEYLSRCPVCGESLANGESIERHHIILNKNDPARDDPRNMRLVHMYCHQQIHHDNRSSVTGALLRRA